MLAVAFGDVKRLAYRNLRNQTRVAKRLAEARRYRGELSDVPAQAERFTSG
jgi:hypothetical protein